MSAFRRRLTLFVRLVLLASAIGLAACDSVQDRIAKHYQRGVELLAQGDYTKAALEFRNVLKLDEKNIPAHLEMVAIAEHDRNLQGAVGHLKRIVELDPGQVEAQTKLARYMLVAGANDEASQHIAAALRRAPNDAEALALKGALALNEGDTEGALTAAHAALEADPNNATAGMVLVGERQRAGDLKRAGEIADLYLAANPKNLPLNLMKLQLLEKAGDDKGIEAHLSHLVDLFPEEPDYRRLLARFYEQKGNEAGAEAQLRAIAAADPGNSAAALDIARFLYRANGIDAARAELDRLIKGAENPSPYELALAQIDFGAGKQDEARSRLEALIKRGGTDDDVNAARVMLAQFQLASGDRDKALALADEVLKTDSKNVAALAVRASVLIDAGDYDKAIVALRAGLNEDPKNVSLLLLAATAHERNGNPDLAGERLASAVSASDYAADPTMRYVRFLQGRDKPQGAVTVLESAIRSHPDDLDLLAALGQAKLAVRDWDGADKIAVRLDAIGGAKATDMADRIRATSLAGQRKYSETLDVLQRISARDKDAGSTMGPTVQAYIGAGQADKAVQFIDAQLAKDPHDARALRLRGGLHQLAGETGKAEASYQAAIDADPASGASYAQLAQLYLAENRRDDAEKVMRAGLKAAPDSPELMLDLGGILEARGDFAEAIDLYGALHEERPDSFVAANNYASLLADHRADDPQSIERAYDAAKRLRGTNIPQFQDTYGWLQYLRGDYNGALRTLIPVAEALSGNPWVRYHIGMTYAKLGKPAEARQNLEAALSLAGETTFTKADEVRATLAGLQTD